MGKHPLRAEKDDYILMELSLFTWLICNRKVNCHLLLNASKLHSVLGPKLFLSTVENMLVLYFEIGPQI